MIGWIFRILENKVESIFAQTHARTRTLTWCILIWLLHKYCGLDFVVDFYSPLLSSFSSLFSLVLLLWLCMHLACCNGEVCCDCHCCCFILPTNIFIRGNQWRGVTDSAQYTLCSGCNTAHHILIIGSLNTLVCCQCFHPRALAHPRSHYIRRTM